MRIAMLATIGMTLLAAAPATGHAQRSDDSSMRDRVRGVLQERDEAQRSGNRDGAWDWQRGRDDDRNANRNANRNNKRNNDRDYDRNRRNDRGYGYGYGYGYGRNDSWMTDARDRREFDRKTRHWNNRQWNAYRACEQDLLRRARWDRIDSRREELRERRRIRDYCMNRVSRW